jgi:hypothetical protein
MVIKLLFVRQKQGGRSGEGRYTTEERENKNAEPREMLIGKQNNGEGFVMNGPS